MKILDVARIREWDSYTIENEPVASVDLMERAALACSEWLKKKYGQHTPFYIFCGMGNNGGDGMAIARLLREEGFSVKVFLVNSGNKPSADFTTNMDRLKKLDASAVKEINAKDLSSLKPEKNAVLIDALFGSGLSKPLEGLNEEVVKFMNESGRRIISIDVPSGLDADSVDTLVKATESSKNGQVVTRANHTLTFQSPKFTFLFPDAHQFTGDLVVLPIGLSEEFIQKAKSDYTYVNLDFAASIFKPRKKFDHKGKFGHALMVSGSYGKMGAAVLASRACLRSGVGLLTIYAPTSGYNILQLGVPEAMVILDNDEICINRIPPEIEKYEAIGIGPGIGTSDTTAYAIKQLVKASKQPMVLDADALNIMAEGGITKGIFPNDTILTPHVKEFERLAGESANSFQRHEKQIAFAKLHKVYMVLKGAYTGIACPDGSFYFNSTGNPGMAKGGSGDVLTGVITALLAHGYDAKEAAILGVYVHGRAGDIAAAAQSMEAITASDITDKLGEAFLELEKYIG